MPQGSLRADGWNLWNVIWRVFVLQFDFSISYLGGVVASYSVGQMIAAPILGFLSQYFSPFNIIQISLVICVIANLLYANIHSFPAPLFWFIFTRFLAGASSGTLVPLLLSSLCTYLIHYEH